jgi:predicted porin
MKRLTLLLLGLVTAVSATAAAQGLTMQMSNGWTFSFAGNVNAFWVVTKENTTAGDAWNSSVRTGLLPAFATFEAKGKEAGLNLGIHFGFAPQINTGARHDHFGPDAAGAQIDMRQVYLTVGGDWGQILAGRELGLFGRQNIVNDMTLFGVGAVGIGGGQGRGTTLGRIGYGYIYPNFVSQVTYSSKGGEPAQISIGLFEPSVLGSGYTVTKIPRVEAEFTYNQKSGENKYLFWVGGVWQQTWNAPTGGNNVASFGGTAGIRVDIQDFSAVVNAYIGKGLGTTLMFSGAEVAANGTDTRKSDGGYAQLMYTFNKKTSVGASYGFSRLVNDQTGDGNKNVRSNLYSYTVGIYHQWTKALKFVLEGTEEGTTGETAGLFAGLPSRAKQTDVTAGLMLFY